jgi:hypothetical protein
MYFKLGYMMVNYLDNFGGTETKENGWTVSEGNAQRNQFRRRLTNIPPGLTQPAITCNFPKRD